MAVLEIKKYPNPILRRKATDVKEITPEIQKLAEDTTETMQQNQGVGLAASQVGESKRIIAVQTEEGPRVFINPKITKKSKEKDDAEEGCLSLPGVWLKINRAKWIELEALDINGKKLNIKADGLFSRVIQHEIDHLDGILITGRISLFQKIKFFHKRALLR